MDLELIRSFLTVTECGCISKAADRLHLTQPALSKQIRKLEGELGTVLFHRLPTGMELTEGGKLFHEKIREVYRGFLEAVDSARKQADLSVIRMGTLPSVASFFLPDRIREWSSTGIKLHLHVAPSSEPLLHLLRAGKMDAAICEPEKPGDRGNPPVHSLPLLEDPFVATVPEEFLPELKDALTLEDLERFPLSCPSAPAKREIGWMNCLPFASSNRTSCTNSRMPKT